MTSEHTRETVETIDWSTVCEHGPFLDYQKTVKKKKLNCITCNMYKIYCTYTKTVVWFQR